MSVGSESGATGRDLEGMIANLSARLRVLERTQPADTRPSFFDLREVGGRAAPTAGQGYIWDDTIERLIPTTPAGGGGIQGDLAHFSGGTTVAAGISGSTAAVWTHTQEQVGTSIVLSGTDIQIATAGTYLYFVETTWPSQTGDWAVRTRLLSTSSFGGQSMDDVASVNAGDAPSQNLSQFSVFVIADLPGAIDVTFAQGWSASVTNSHQIGILRLA